ncbi:MAG: cupredoxin domain-containing protein [Candidatus Dormibacteria bacterium]
MNARAETPGPGRGGWPWRLPAIVLVVLLGILVSLGVSVAAIAGIADGVHVVASQLAAAKAGPAHALGSVTESMELQTDKQYGPQYTHASWTVHQGETVVLRITSYDDGAAPLTGVQTMFTRVEGTLGGLESVDGTPVRSVPNQDLAHTFTVPGLGLNLPIPAAPTGGSVTVVARFVASRTGSFVWQCYAPCGSGSNSMGGAMSTMGWMEGRVKVVA